MPSRTSIVIETRNPVALPDVHESAVLIRRLELLATPTGQPIAGSFELQALAGIDPALGHRMEALYAKVAPYQDPLLEALFADPAYGRRFLEDPLPVFEEITGAPADVMEELRDLAREMQRRNITLSRPDETTSDTAVAAASGSSDLAAGWDLVAAARFKEVNAALAQAYAEGKLPSAFTWDMSVAFGSLVLPVVMSGVFESLQLAGGTGRDVEVALGLASGTMTGMTPAPLDIQGMRIVLTINLDCVTTSVAQQGARYDFLINIANQSTWRAVRLENLPPGFDATDSLMTVLKNYLKAEFTGKSFLVASVALGSLPNQRAYLRPTAAGYAFATDPQRLDDSVLAIQLLTVDPKPGETVVLPGTIPKDTRASFLISNPLFMKYEMLPSVAQGFSVPTSTFTSKGSPSATIENVDDFTLKKVDHDPKITSLEVVVLDGAFDFRMKGEAEVSPGISVRYKVHARYGLRIVNQNGEQQLSLEELLFESSHDTKVEWWVWVVTAGAAALALPIVGIIMAALAPIIVGIVKAAVQGATPSLSASLFASAVMPVEWNGLGVLAISDARVPTPIQLVGAVKPPAH